MMALLLRASFKSELVTQCIAGAKAAFVLSERARQVYCIAQLTCAIDVFAL